MMNFLWDEPFNVICGTPCIGKTAFAAKYYNVVDLESSPYKYLDYDKSLAEIKKGTWLAENPNFLKDYVYNIKSYVNIGALVLLPMYKELRDELDLQNIKFAIAYSPLSAKQNIIDRFTERGNDKNFVNNVMSKFEERLIKLESDKHIKIPVNPGQYLEQTLIEYKKRNK